MRKRAIAAAAAVLLAAALVFKMWVPVYALAKINQGLEKVGEYRGSVKKVSFSVLKGTCEVDGLELVKATGKVPVPFFSAGRVACKLHWPALFRGAVVAEIDVYDPQLNFVAAPAPDAEQVTIRDPSWQERLRGLVPLRIDRFQVHNGEVHFRNYHSEPEIDLSANAVEATASNLTNSRRFTGTLEATVEAEGRLMTKGRFEVHLALDPFAEEPTFKTRSRVRFALPEINDFFRHYLGVEAKDGSVDVYLEGTAADGSFRGYVKPVIESLDVLRLKDEGLRIDQAVKGVFAKIAAALFKNPTTQDLGTKVEISGTFDSPDVNVWGAIGTFVNNAFFRAVLPGFEGAASLRDVAKTQVFGK